MVIAMFTARPTWRSPWTRFLVLGLLLIGSYGLVPLHLRGLYFTAMSAFGMLGVAIGIRLNRPDRRKPWLLLLAGLGSVSLGNAIYAAFQYLFEYSGSIVPLANAFYFMGYGLMAAALVALAASKADARRTLLEGSIAATAVGMGWWALFMEPHLRISTQPLLEQAIYMAYPFIDLLLLGTLVAVLVSPTSRTVTLRLLVLAVSCELFADAIYSLRSLTNEYAMGGRLDVLWFVTYVLLGTAAIHPSMRDTKILRGSGNLSRLVLFTSPAIAAPAFVAIEASRGNTTGAVVVTAMCMLVTTLMLVRFRLAVREERGLLETKEDLERRYRSLVESLPAIVYRAAPGIQGEWSYISPQIEQMLGYRPEEWMSDPQMWFSKVHVDDQQSVLAAESAAMSQEVWSVPEYRIHTKDGRLVWVRDQATLVRDEAGNALYFQGAMYDVTKEKEAEAATARSQARKTAVLETALDCIITADENGNIVDFNPAAERTFGYSREEVVGRPIAETIVPPGQRRAHADGFLRFVATGDSRILGQRLERTACRRDGSEFPVELSITAIDDGGKPLVTAYLRDITARKAGEQALRASEERFQQAFRNSVAGLAVGGVNQLITVNPALCQMLGFDEDTLAELGWSAVVHPEDWPQVERVLEEMVTGASVNQSFFGLRFIREDGGTVWTDTSVSALRGSSTSSLVLIQVQDVTRRKEAEASRDRLVATLEAAPDFIGIADAEGNLIYLNTGARRILGIPEDEDVSKLSAADIRPPWAQRQAVEEIRPAAVRDGMWQGESAFLSRDGQEVPLSQVLVAHKGADGSVAFYSTIARDLTELRKLEAQVRHSQKMEAVGRLAGGIAHDFNNLLAVILNYAAFLEEECPAGDRSIADLVEIRTAAERGTRLVRQLLTFSRKDVVAARTLDINEEVQGVEKLLHRLIEEQIQLEVQPGRDLAPIRMDPSQLEQILVNLVVNARDAMPMGGRILIETASEIIDGRKVSKQPELTEGRYVRLSVIDDGVGMSNDVKARIFEPFFTTKGVGVGTGLGLSSVYGAVEQSGGFITVQTEPGSGTAFHIYLPAAADSVHATPRPAPAAPVGQGETILVVEDEEAVRDLLVRILSGAGYEVLAAACGADALNVVDERGRDIDLVLTDVIMPKMSARQLADALAVDHPSLKVVFISGYTDDVIARAEIMTGQEVLIQKPFTRVQLLGTLRAVLDESPVDLVTR